MHAHVPVPLDVRAAAPPPGDNQTAPARLAPSTPGSLPHRCRGAPAIARRQSANAQDAPPPARASPHLARAQLPRRGDPRPALPPAQGPDPLAHLPFPLTHPPPLASRWPSPPGGSPGPTPLTPSASLPDHQPRPHPTRPPLLLLPTLTLLSSRLPHPHSCRAGPESVGGPARTRKPTAPKLSKHSC